MSEEEEDVGRHRKKEKKKRKGKSFIDDAAEEVSSRALATLSRAAWESPCMCMLVYRNV